LEVANVDAALIVTSVVGVVGAGIGGSISLVSERLRERSAAAERQWESRRDAYVTFISVASRYGNALANRADGSALVHQQLHQELMQPLWLVRLTADAATRQAVEGVMLALYEIREAWDAQDIGRAERAHREIWISARDRFHSEASRELRRV
jgi:hypothetical protein